MSVHVGPLLCVHMQLLTEVMMWCRVIDLQLRFIKVTWPDRLKETEQFSLICFGSETLFINITHQSHCWADSFWQMNIVLSLLDMAGLCVYCACEIQPHTLRDQLCQGSALIRMMEMCDWQFLCLKIGGISLQTFSLVFFLLNVRFSRPLLIFSSSFLKSSLFCSSCLKRVWAHSDVQWC